MKISVAVALMLFVAALAAFVWSGPSKIRHYTADELLELTCEELGERHTEVINVYHDAEIAHYRRTGAFHDDLGIPPEDIVPFAVLIEWFVRSNDISEAHIKGNFPEMPILSTSFYYEVSGICATNPSWQATGAMQQAAINLGLIDG